MKHSSRVALFASLSLFATAGALGFWPEPQAAVRVAGGPPGPGMTAPAPPEGGFGPASARSFASDKEASASTPEPGPVALRARDMPIQKALTVLFQQVGYPYHIDPRVSGRVTADIKGAGLESAIRQVLKAGAPSAAYRRSGDLYLVYLRHSPAPIQASMAGVVRAPLLDSREP